MTVGDFVLQAGQTVVLTGDSITDCGRRNEETPFGNGYVRMIRSLSMAKRPDRDVRFLNTGVGGDTILDLAERWDADVLAHRPHWLSISIGVNDVWRQVRDVEAPGVELGEFTAVYRDLLERTRAKLSGCGFILMTPGIIGEDPETDGNRLMKPYIEAVRDLAGKFNAFCVPIHDTMLGAVGGKAGALTRDGVHPTDIGHALMALTWLQTLGW